MTKHSRPGVANKRIQMPSEIVVSTHLNSSEEAMKKNHKKKRNLFSSGISQDKKTILPYSVTLDCD